MYAIIESCGKQYKVAKGDVVFFEKLDTEVNKKCTFDKVILVSEEGKIQVGNPYVKGVKVEGKVISHGKGKKIIVYKMKPKKNYRRKQGHRQPYTKVEITEIKLSTSKTAEVKEEVAKKEEQVKQPTEKKTTKTTATKKATSATSSTKKTADKKETVKK